jgi:hypothetical protein
VIRKLTVSFKTEWPSPSFKCFRRKMHSGLPHFNPFGIEDIESLARTDFIIDRLLPSFFIRQITGFPSFERDRVEIDSTVFY